MNLRSVARDLAYRSGSLQMLHRLRNRECLTVVMFHRVLPERERLQFGADPTYTVSPEFLAECRSFFERHYDLVSVEDVALSRRRIKALPAWPLLITFDDGWRDNLQWALPVLAGIPWTIFVATDAVQQEDVWWQEALLWALRSGASGYEDLLRHATTDGPYGARAAELVPELALLLAYSKLSVERRDEVLAPFSQALRRRYCGSIMLSGEDLRSLHKLGVSIGAHSASHLPLTEIADATDDLKRARNWLDQVLSGSAAPAMSFPHGRWDRGLLGSVRNLGYELVFTSSPVINACPSGWLQSHVLGRIPIMTTAARNRAGAMAPARMATWLYGRPRHA